MSRSSGNSSGCQSENHGPDSGQARKTNPETTKDTLATKRKEEPSLTTSQGIDLWFTKIEETGGHHKTAEDDAKDDSCDSESLEFTPLHKLLERIENDDDGSHELGKLLNQQKSFIDVRCPENQETALHMAVRKGFKDVVHQLLTAGANVNIENGSGELPLQLACDSGDQQLVKMLLENGADPNKTVGGAHWTPLNNAIYDGREDVVDILLEGGASLRIQDSDGWTPLMTAIKRGRYKTFHKLLRHLREHPAEQENPADQEHPAEPKVVDIPDNNGMTPLMQLGAGSVGESTIHAIEGLLQIKPNVDATDNEGKTALHHAMTSAYRMRPKPNTDVALKLVQSLSVEKLMNLDKDGETAFDIAFDQEKKSPVPAFQPLLNSLVDRLAQGESIEEPLCWAAYRLERHSIAQELLHKKFSAEDICQDLKPDQWAIVEWAIYARMPRVLLTYLRALGLEKRANEENARDRWQVGKERRRSVRQAKSIQTKMLKDILDYLYPEKTEKPTKPLELSKPDQGMASSLKNFRAAIIQSNFVKFRTIQEVLYDDDSMEHIQDNVKRLRQFEYSPKVSSEQASQNSDESEANTKTSAQFTWIHLPSTNMTWMEDTAKKILKGEGCDKSEAEKVASFLRSSWIEIPDRTSTSRFMRPRYVVKKADNATGHYVEDEDDVQDASDQGSRQTGTHSQHEEQRENHNGSAHTVIMDGGEAEKGKSFAVSAIYMPYLYFSTYHQSESGEKTADEQTVRPKDPSGVEQNIQDELKMLQSLFKAYKHSVIHQPTTLDEFYYQFASDEESIKDRNSRNKDQVITRCLQSRGVKTPRYWPLLRVSQLWVWTINNKWLITSTSCATNDIRDSLVTDILEHLQRQVENGSRRFGPASATEMSRVIVDYCIGAYDRKRRRQRQETRSIHQLFSDSINKIGREESKFFSQSSDRRNNAIKLEGGLDADRTSAMMKDLWAALTTVSEQLCHIKDIRDELNILMSIARFQRKVQVTMDGKGAGEDLSSQYLLKDMKELDKFAEQTQEAVKTTLTLQESDIASFQAQIANWQARESMKQGEESVKQGKIVLIFTLVTVWFLPLSFLTSLFALDVATFMKTPAWAFYIIFLVPLMFLISAIGYVWKAEIKSLFAKCKTPAKGPGGEGEEATSTSRSVPDEKAPRRRTGVDVEHGWS
ncbi:hypothetical protein CDV31_014904 [Fusarium ambrosium]|uniref:Uncharacterized protein n=1 Tax=Fusarium ambrosium TaxID=131363 RepID=A0A428STA5_9HYPO|nr:hypothetical protein CDV31_014904 [Fusarium ambrosium]